MGQVKKMNVAHEQEPEARHRLASGADWSRVQVMSKVSVGILLFLNVSHNISIHTKHDGSNSLIFYMKKVESSGDKRSPMVTGLVRSRVESPPTTHRNSMYIDN